MMKNKISIMRIVEDTIVDGPGLRLAIYAAGCNHQCFNCHNPESWDINNGTNYTIDQLIEIIVNNEHSDITFTGGDPLFQAEEFTQLAKQIKQKTTKNIWCYTGYTYEQVINNKQLKTILNYIDVLVDGKFMEKLKDEQLYFRGSSNQRLIDVNRSLKENKIVLFNYQPLPKFSYK